MFGSALEIMYSVMALVVVVFFATALLQYLWNITLPQVSTLKVITFRQAFRILLIGALLSSAGFIHLGWHP